MKKQPKPMRFVSDVDIGTPGARNVACLAFGGSIFDGVDLLDVGCWVGNFLSLLRGKARSITGLDVEPEALAVASDVVPEARFVEASVLDLPFENGRFDVVTLWAVLEHLPVGTEERALREIARVLRPNGYLAINVPNGSFLSKALDPIFFLKRHRHYGRDELVAMIEQVGLSVERLSVTGRWISAFSFYVFCVWKYVFRRPQPNWPRYMRACEKDALRDGFLELYLLARRNSV